MQNVEDVMRDLDNCGDKYCGKIITAQQMKDEGLIFLKKVIKDCRSTTQPANEQEYKLQREKYNIPANIINGTPLVFSVYNVTDNLVEQ